MGRTGGQTRKRLAVGEGARRQIFTAGLLLTLLVLPLITPNTAAQAAADTLTLERAMQLAATNHPAIRSAQARVSASAAGIGLARTAYLPRTDMLWQMNRATRNNVFGMLLPQGVIPSISGPVLPATSLDSVWGSAGGLLFAWEPFDFGARRAGVAVAEAERSRSSAVLQAATLETQFTAADAFLTVIAAQQRVRAAQANIDRMNVFLRSVQALVKQQLRPGAEESRATAELAAARTVWIEAKQSERIAHAALAQALGAVGGQEPPLEAGPLLKMPPGPAAPAPPARVEHPAVRAQEAAVDVVRAREHVLDRSWYPRFNLQSAVYGRGTGALTNGGVQGGANGLAPDVGNWAAGLTITFPLFDYASLRARRRVEAFQEQSEAARVEQVRQSVGAQAQKARALLDGARQVAANTPVQLDAARTAERQARARYQAGLTSVVEVAEAQRLLAQAEADEAVARLGVWRALLYQAAAAGDLAPFLSAVRAAAGTP